MSAFDRRVRGGSAANAIFFIVVVFLAMTTTTTTRSARAETTPVATTTRKLLGGGGSVASNAETTPVATTTKLLDVGGSVASNAETTPVVATTTTRKLLGGGGSVASNAEEANGPTYNALPPPPPPSTLNQKLRKVVWNYIVDVISSRGAETAAIEQLEIEEKHQSLPKTNSESEFANTLTRMANALSTEKGLARIEHGVDDFSDIDSSVHDALCRSDAFVREFNQSSFDDSYVQAHPMNGEEIPNGCYRGCILGNDWKTTIAKFYGIRRTLTFNSWRGKCFKKVIDEIDGSETTAVTNRIKLSYGPIVNALLGLNEPIELYKGDVEYEATSIFDGKASIGINYSKFGHEFSKFRDEIRQVYPGVYIGKMYMLPGLDLFPNEDGTDSIFKIPEDGTPQFAMNFILMRESDGSVPT